MATAPFNRVTRVPATGTPSGPTASEKRAFVSLPRSGPANASAAGSFHGTRLSLASTAAITAIKLKDGKAMVVGKRGNFAVMSEDKDREVLEHALKATKNLATWAEPINAWLAARISGDWFLNISDRAWMVSTITGVSTGIDSASPFIRAIRISRPASARRGSSGSSAATTAWPASW